MAVAVTGGAAWLTLNEQRTGKMGERAVHDAHRPVYQREYPVRQVGRQYQERQKDCHAQKQETPEKSLRSHPSRWRGEQKNRSVLQTRLKDATGIAEAQRTAVQERIERGRQQAVPAEQRGREKHRPERGPCEERYERRWKQQPGPPAVKRRRVRR